MQVLEQMPASEEVPECDWCLDARFVRHGIRVLEADRWESRMEPCPKCNPMPKTYGIPDFLALATFGSFDLKLNPGMKPALQRCQAVAAGEEWCALLLGAIGVGKSHLAAAALNASVHPRPGQYWRWGGLLLRIREQAFSDSGPHMPEDFLLRPYQEGRFLLVLDDVGAEKLTEWAQQTLYAVLNARYEARLPTIVTGNDPDAIDDRVLSRYFEGSVACKGQDIRRR